MNKNGYNGRTHTSNIDYKRWGEPAKIVAGVQIDAPHMDGKMVGCVVCDRYGNELSKAERGDLMRYREHTRDEWIRSKK